ncbi:MAG TPA: uroporphyrinogen-III synthase [Candidatus Methanoperedens sp.]
MKIAVTKLKEKSEGIPELFARYGHEAFLVSTMHPVEPSDPKPLLRLCDMISKNEIDILIFTSALGVEKLFEKVKPRKTVRIVSVGPKTADKVEEYGLSGEVITKFSSDNFALYLGDIKGKIVGVARAEVPNPELINSLVSKGATVIEAPAYTLLPEGNRLGDIIKDMDAVIFTSARSFESSGFDSESAKKIKVVAIGPRTADAMRKHGVIPDIVGNGTLENCLSLLSIKRITDTGK